MAVNNPLVSVIMPAYNAEKVIEESVSSILSQTYSHFEFLIFEDGSSDRTLDILKGFRDDRITLFHAERNQGYLVHLNEGIRISRGKYIARMDNDDFSLPERFARQVDFLEKNPEHGLCGCWFQEISGQKEIVKKPPVHHDELVLTLLKKNPFCHSSVMIRKDTLTRHHLSYDPEYYTSEDYLLWARLAGVSRLHTIPGVLHRYHSHPQNLSTLKRDEQRKLAMKIQLRNLEVFSGMKLNPEQEEVYLKLLWGRPLQVGDFSVADDLLFSLLASNREKRFFDQKRFERFIRRLGQRLIVQAVKAEKYTGTRISKFHVYRMLPLYRRIFMDFNTRI